MTFRQAQSEMRRGYASGATGILASALAWLAASGVAVWAGPRAAIVTLLAGGMLIFPVSLLLCRMVGIRAGHPKANPLGRLAGASTFWLIFSLPIAYGVGLGEPSRFFLAMLLVIGGRYLVFATVYGMDLYWVLGLTLAASAFALALLRAPLAVIAGAGAAIELGFGVACSIAHRRWQDAPLAAAAR